MAKRNNRGTRTAAPPGGQSRTTVPPRGQTRNRPSKRRPGRSPKRWVYRGGGLLAIVVAVVLIVVFATGGNNKNSVKTGQPAINWKTPAGIKAYGGLGPENVPIEVGAALAPRNPRLTGQSLDGISCLSGEQIAYHHHVHLAIFVDGKPYSIPLGTGMVGQLSVAQSSAGQFVEGASTCLYWLHVHAQDGIVHIESPEARQFELGQFFDIWGIPLSSSQLGSYKGAVTATVNGQPWTEDPTAIQLTEHSSIVLNVGTPVVSPPAISWSGTGL